MRSVATSFIKGWKNLTHEEKESLYSAVILALQWGLPDRLKQPDPEPPSPIASAHTSVIRVNIRK